MHVILLSADKMENENDPSKQPIPKNNTQNELCEAEITCPSPKTTEHSLDTKNKAETYEIDIHNDNMAQKDNSPEIVLLTFSEALEVVSDPSPQSTGGNEHHTGINETNKPSIKSDPSPNTIGANEHGSCENKTNKPNINISMATNQNVNVMKCNNISEDEHGSCAKNTNNIGGDKHGSGADKTHKVSATNKT